MESQSQCPKCKNWIPCVVVPYFWYPLEKGYWKNLWGAIKGEGHA